MRTTSNSSLNKQLVKQFVRPVYLLEIEYANNTSYRFHSGDGGVTSILNVSGIGYSNDWTGNDVRVSGIGWDIGQRSIPTVSIQNMDLNMSSIMLNNDIPDRPVRLWMLYIFEKYIVTLAQTAASGASTLTVQDTIPAEVTASGNLNVNGTATYDKSYTSRSTNAFILATTLTSAVSAGTQIYLPGPGMTGSYTANDVIPLFSGVANEIELDEKRVTISLLPQSAKTQYVPNRYITKYNNFNWLPKTGTQIVWGNETFILEKATY